VKVKNITTEVIRCDFVPGGYVDPGAVVDVPDKQPDGSELIWHPEYWEPVSKAKPSDVKE
jgi:hypothetical protein